VRFPNIGMSVESIVMAVAVGDTSPAAAAAAVSIAYCCLLVD
jgi:hypothetical protein